MGLEVTPCARTIIIAAASQSTIQSSSSSVIMDLGAAGVVLWRGAEREKSHRMS
jgi:hypothetical protein